jgi:hypothetical protein
VITRLVILALMVSVCVGPLARAGDDATAQARSHYEIGLRLFDVRDHEQALIEFAKANELKTRPAAVFMMAQCEYLLGRLKDARAHYQSYVSESPDGEFVELAKDRIESIDKRVSTFVINTVPDDVTVRITPEGKSDAAPVVGQAPNNFSVPRGRYRIDITKRQYIGQTRLVEVDVAETKPLFFKLDPIPARLEIETSPPAATLYVNGNRARNPYRQDVVAGHYEIFAETVDHVARTLEFDLAPGERKMLLGPGRLKLQYVQRSGRPELIVASTLMGGLVGAGAVAAALGSHFDGANVASVSLVAGGAFTGFVGGALIATRVVSHYIPDNRALFVLGSMWLGVAEGAGVGIVSRQLATFAQTPAPPCPGPSPCRGSIGDQLRAGFIGTIPGLAVGLTTGSLLSSHAPTYGRAALIQSAAVGGALTGILFQVATRWRPYGPGWEFSVREVAPQAPDLTDHSCDVSTDPGHPTCAFPESSFLDRVPAALIGLNVGLVAGILGAYLPDQSKYGPSWRRVMLIDLAAVAGVVAGGVAGCVSNVDGCLTREAPLPGAYARSAVTALIGGAAGAVGGVLLTRHLDDEPPAESPGKTSLAATLLPIRASDGSVTTGVGALGTF